MIFTQTGCLAVVEHFTVLGQVRIPLTRVWGLEVDELVAGAGKTFLS